MTFTRDNLGNFSEELLRTAVLIPLFKAMGFRDVFHYHGGSLEQGKDIVMWKIGDLRPRVNYAVVVKKGDVSGKTSGGGSAGEVGTQIQQCFGKPYLDPVTMTTCEVDRCIVAASGRISKEAANAMNSIIKRQNLSSATDFIDGDRLWELVEKHLPEKMAREMIVQGHQLLEGNVPGHQVTLLVNSETTSLHIKHVDDSVPPAIRVDPSVLNENEEESEPFKKFIETGEPLEINSQTIRRLVLPEAVQHFLNVDAGKVYTLGHQTEILGSQHLQFIRIGKDGKVSALPPTELDYVRVGTQEVTLSNEHRNNSCQLSLKLRRDGQLFHLTFKGTMAGTNVKQALDYAQFQHALAKPGQIVLRDMQTSLETPMHSDEGIKAEVDLQFIELLETLTYIQVRTYTPITLGEYVSPHEEDLANEICRILKTGYGRPIESCSGKIHRSKLMERGNLFLTPAPFEASNSKDTIWKLLGAEINLGRAKIVCDLAKMPEAEIARFKQQLDNLEEEFIEVVFEGSPPEAPMRMQFPRWIAQDK